MLLLRGYYEKPTIYRQIYDFFMNREPFPNKNAYAGCFSPDNRILSSHFQRNIKQS